MSLRKNSVYSALEVIISGLGLFFIYKNVVAELGVSMLGVWSLVLATTAFGRLADVGISAGLARFIAASRGLNDKQIVRDYFVTAFLAVAVLMGALCFVAWLPLQYALSLGLSGEQLTLAQSLLPWALVTFWLLNLNAVFAATFLGLQRSDIRAQSTCVGMLFQIVISLLLIKQYGLKGLALAQIGQYLLAIAYMLVANVAMHIGLLFGKFRLDLLKELFGFGIKLQVGTIANILFEPLSKIIIGGVAGTAVLGLFEMAYRMVYQARAVAIMVLQNLLPLFAQNISSGTEKNYSLIRKGNLMGLYGGTILMVFTVCVSPLISWLWLGELDSSFVKLVGIISFCWLINITCAPAYFYGVAIGKLNANIGGQLLTAMLSPALGFFIGRHFDPNYVVHGILFGKIVGDIMPMIFNYRGLNEVKLLNLYIGNIAALVALLGAFLITLSILDGYIY